MLNRIFFLFSCIVCLSSLAYAQGDKALYLKQIGGSDPIFETDTFPVAWKNESAVILADKITSEVFEATPMIGYRRQHRTRILLLDAAAVKDFSLFYFDEEMNKKIKKKGQEHTSFDSLQILVKKTNGTSKLIDLSTAIKEEKTIKIPELYKRRFLKTSSYYKIAIADLEPGDIIDFCTTYKILFPIDYVRNSFSFPDIDYTLDNTYHTVKHKLVVKFPTKAKANKFGFNMLYLNSYNGAPPVKQETLNDVMICTLEANLLPKSIYERWQYPYLSVPSVKGYLTYVNASERNLTMYAQYPNAVPFGRTSVIKMNDIYNTMNFNTQYSMYIWYSDVKNSVNQSYDGGEVMSYLRQYHSRVHNTTEIARHAFYYLRTKSYSSDWNYDNENFIGLMKEVLNAYHAKYTHLITVPRSHSTLENVLLRDDLHVLLKVKVEGDGWEEPEEDQYIYLSNVNDDINFGELETKYQGAEAYEYTKQPTSAIRKVTIPVIPFMENGLTEKSSYTISNDLETVSVESQKTVKGSVKKSFYDSLSFRNEYWAHDIAAYQDSTYVSKFDTTQRKENQRLNQQTRIEFRKNAISETVSLESYDDLKVIQDGRTFDKQELIFEEKYKLKELISAAGTKHLLPIGKLIGQQVEIKENELNRKTDIYMDAARFYEYQITIYIPQGYTLQNIEKLNVNVSNETGAFHSEAKIENNALVLKVAKMYHHNFEKKEDWPKMVAFLDACYDFTQSKVFLVKK